ncbi:hypothetical protein V496_05349 [Pseudogymnoascus sp. VKM F-4515 (FW-2607)]|nr:hypothetical protein V496_05349 [Pseudogymnoascus sp. VKM F-4515 (FW-2607)]KFY78761.1 hypothetical protein V498_09057 [Pseudogymnoascus sp. VKM F-4517 (FW-2822)]
MSGLACFVFLRAVVSALRNPRGWFINTLPPAPPPAPLLLPRPRAACAARGGVSSRGVAVETALGEVCGESLVVEEASVAGEAVGMRLRPADVGAEGEAGGEGEGARGAGGLGWHSGWVVSGVG